MQLAIMAFFARISDPAVGGTYMTFLNTLNNLGTMWPRSFALWFVDILSGRSCPEAETSLLVSNATAITNTSYTEIDCELGRDGYYELAPAGCLVGAVWLVWGWRALARLQAVPPHAWRVVNTRREDKTDPAGKFNYFYCT